jgi:hypothetical protein
MATMAETRPRAASDSLDRLSGPVAGILAVVGWIVSTIILDVAESADTGPEILTVYQNDDGRILAGGIIWLISTALFFVFLGALRSRLLAAEGGEGRWTAVAFAGGIATAICLALLPGPDMAAAIQPDDLDGSASLALSTVGDAFFLGAEYLLPVLLVSSAVIALRYGALPRWLAWIQILIAIVLLTGFIGWAALIFAFPLWVLVVAYLMWQSPPAPRSGV